MEIGKEYIYNTDIIGKTKVHSLESNYKINIKNSIIYKEKIQIWIIIFLR